MPRLSSYLARAAPHTQVGHPSPPKSVSSAEWYNCACVQGALVQEGSPPAGASAEHTSSQPFEAAAAALKQRHLKRYKP